MQQQKQQKELTQKEGNSMYGILAWLTWYCVRKSIGTKYGLSNVESHLKRIQIFLGYPLLHTFFLSCWYIQYGRWSLLSWAIATLVLPGFGITTCVKSLRPVQLIHLVDVICAQCYSQAFESQNVHTCSYNSLWTLAIAKSFHYISRIVYLSQMWTNKSTTVNMS